MTPQVRLVRINAKGASVVGWSWPSGKPDGMQW
jgi:hypothetical protein